MPIVDADIDFLRRQRLLGSSSNAPEPSMTEQYLQALGQYPKFPQYKEQPYYPSTGRRILAAIAGAGQGPEAQERVKYAPYNNAMRGYGQRMSALGQGAEMEMSGAKTAAEVYKNRLLGQKAAAEAAIQPQRGEYYSGTGAYRKFLTTPEYGTQQEGIRRAGVAPRVSTFGQQGKALVVMPEGTATTYEVAPPNMQLTDAARIRAGATMGAARIRSQSAGKARYVSPAADAKAQQEAMAHIYSKYPDASNYISLDADTKLPVWTADVTPGWIFNRGLSKAKQDAMKLEFEAKKREILAQTYEGLDEEDDYDIQEEE